MIGELREYDTSEMSVPNKPINFSVLWGLEVVNDHDYERPSIPELKIVVDSRKIRSFSFWWAETIPGYLKPDEYLNPPESQWDYNWWLWHEVPDVMSARVFLSPSPKALITEPPGFHSERSVDEMFFTGPGLQHVTVKVYVKEKMDVLIIRISTEVKEKGLVEARIAPKTAKGPPNSIVIEAPEVVIWRLWHPEIDTSYEFSVNVSVTPLLQPGVIFVPRVLVTRATLMEDLPGMPITSKSITIENANVTPEGGVLGTVTISSSQDITWRGRTLLAREVAYSPIVRPIVAATVDIDPDTLNVKSKGEWVTCYIELPKDYKPEDIAIDTIKLRVKQFEEKVDLKAPIEIGDHDHDGTKDLMVKFNRQELLSYLRKEGVEGDIELVTLGKLVAKEGIIAGFIGKDVIRVINNG
jgi:hypothetical protein